LINYKELQDLELMEEIARYDSRALEELYNRYAPLLFTLIKKIAPDEKTAEYILVEVFSIIWRKIHRFDFRAGNVYTWLVTLARNRAVDSVRRNRNSEITREFYDDEYEDFHILPYLSPEIDSLDFETAMKLKPKIETALSKLTDAQKYVIHLAYYDGFTLDEISKKLNIPVNTVRSKVLTALTNLKDNLLG